MNVKITKITRKDKFGPKKPAKSSAKNIVDRIKQESSNSPRKITLKKEEEMTTFQKALMILSIGAIVYVFLSMFNPFQ